MAEKLPWNEIKRRYPDEWVVLTEYDTAGDEFARGVVAGHSRKRTDLIALCKTVSPFALVYTGEISEGLIGVHADNLEDQR